MENNSNKKVLFIDSITILGGGQNYLIDLINEFIKKEFDVYLSSRESSPLSQISKKLKFNVFDFPVKKRTDIFGMIKYAFYIRRLKFDIVFTTDSISWYTGVLIKLFNLKVKLYAIVHLSTMTYASHFGKVKKLIIPVVDRIWTVFYKKVIVTSDYQYDILKKENINKNKLKLIRLGVNEKRIESLILPSLKLQITVEYKIPPDSKIVGIIGPLIKEKRIEFFIRSIPKVIEKRTDVIFVILGEGEEKGNLIESARKLEVFDKIRFISCDRKNFYTVFSMFDIIVNTTVLASLPTSILEAIILNINFLSVDNEGIRYIFKDSYDCLMFENNEDKLGESILKLLSDSDLSQTLIKNASHTMKMKCDFNKHFHDLIKLLDEEKKI